MSAPEKPSAAARDPLQELAQLIFIELSGRIYSGTGEKPQPKAVAQLAFKLAEVFQAANLEFNPAAIAAREAKSKAAVKLDSVQIDFGAVGKG